VEGYETTIPVFAAGKIPLATSTFPAFVILVKAPVIGFVIASVSVVVQEDALAAMTQSLPVNVPVG
jgi:hypothetical protein